MTDIPRYEFISQERYLLVMQNAQARLVKIKKILAEHHKTFPQPME